MCCFCGVGSALKYLKLACPGNGCITWFILSMVFSIIVFGILIAFQVYLDKGDGQFPIENYKSFTGFLVAGNLFGFFACLACLILIFLNKKSLVLSILCEVALVFGFCVTLYSIYYLSFETPGTRISKYTREFYKKNNATPPFMDYIQRNARVTIPIPDHPQQLGCCGSESFLDYSNSSRRLAPNNETDYLFDVPDSCCLNKTNGCGRNLKYSHHVAELGFLNEAIKYASGGRNKKKMTIDQILTRILKKHMCDMEKIRKEAEAQIKNPTPEKRFLFGAVSQLQNILSKEQIENFRNLLDDLPKFLEAIKTKGDELKNFQENRKKNIKINIIGCGRVFDAVCSSCVTVVVSIQAFINGVTIFVYVYYYVRLGTLRA